MSTIKTKFISDNAVTEAKMRLTNDGAFRARNNAGSADVDLYKLDTGDVLQFLSHPQVSSSAVNSDDVVTKKDMEALQEGLAPKEAVRVATTGNITLSGAQTIDGVILVAGDRVLVWQQTDASENGIYDVAAGAWARSSDFDSLTPEDEIHGAYTMAQEGTEYSGYSFVQYGTVTTIGVDDITFTIRANQTILGGDGINVTGTTITVDHDGEGLTFATNQLALELDGATLSKAGTGLKISDGGVDELQLSSNVDAESFVLSAGYAAAAGTITIGDTIEVAIEKLDGNINAIQTADTVTENFTLLAGDVTNGYVDVANLGLAGSFHFLPDGGPAQREGADFSIADGGGFTRVTFLGDLASGGAAALEAGDTIQIKYIYKP